MTSHHSFVVMMMIDDPRISQVVAALESTLNKDNAVRKAAEQALDEASLVPGYLALLLQIVALPQSPKHVKQAAAVALKNAIRRNWPETPTPHHVRTEDSDEEEEDPPRARSITPPDCELIRANILQALALVSTSDTNDTCTRLLAECVGLIAESDFPSCWPDLVPSLSQLLAGAQNHGTLVGLLLGLRRIMKRFEYRRSERLAAASRKPDPRLPINLLVESLFPSLLVFAQRMLADPQEDGRLVHLIAKTYLSATRNDIPPTLKGEVATAQWLGLWEACLQRVIPASQGGTDELDDLSLRPWWKAKKAALQIAVKAVQRATDALATEKAEAVAMSTEARLFVEAGLAERFLVLCMSMLQAWVTAGAPLPKRLLQLCLSYLCSALEPAKTYKVLRPHLKFFVADVVLKVLRFSDEDKDDWQTEPEMYASRCLTPLDDPFDPRATACALLRDACTVRSKDVLDGVVQHLLMGLQNHASMPPAEFDAVLYAIGALSEVLAPMTFPGEEDDMDDGNKKKKKGGANARAKKYLMQLEIMLARFVVPELTSPEAHLRLRAVWVVGQYAHIPWTNVEAIKQAVEGMLDRVNDPELPVQVMACKSLRAIFDLEPVSHALTCAVIKEVTLPRLVPLVQSYLQVMSRLGADDVVAGLQSLIDAFQLEIAPMATEICAAIVQAFTKYAMQEDDEDGDFGAAAMQCLDACMSLLGSVCEIPELLQKMETVVMPLLVLGLKGDSEVSDFTQNYLELYTYFTYYSVVPMSPAVWQVVGILGEIFHSYGFDYLPEMSTPLEQLVLREPLRFATTGDEETKGKTYLEVVFGMCRTVLQDIDLEEDGAAERDLRAALELLKTMILATPRPHTFGAAQADVFRMVTHWLVQKRTKLAISTRVRCFEVFEACFWHCPAQVMQVLGETNLHDLLLQIREVLPAHGRKRQKQTCAFALANLLSVREINALDKALVVCMLAELSANLDDAAAAAAEKREDDENDSQVVWEDGEDEDEDGEYDENEDAANDENEAYREFMHLHQDTGGAFWEEDDPNNEVEEDDEDYPWPMHGLDLVATLQKAVSEALASPEQGETIRQVLAATSEEVKDRVNKIVGMM
jgi:hypothetical protein